MSDIPSTVPTTHGITSGIANSAPQASPIDVPAWGPTDLDNEVANFAKQYQAELDAEEPAPESAAPVATKPAESAPAAEKPAETNSGVFTADQVQREVALKLREDRISLAETRYQEMEARYKELESRQVPADLTEGLRSNTTATLKQLGLDPDMVIKMALAEKLQSMGQAVDPGLQAQIDKASTQRQIQALENKIISQNRESAARAYFDSVQAGARQYVAQEVSKDAPTLAEVAKSAPDKVHQEIMNEIISDARARAQTEGPGGKIMTYTDAAKRVEARFSELRGLLAPGAPATTNASMPSAQTQVEQKKAPAVIKPPERPLAPWLQKVDVQEQGLREAMDEFRRLEKL